jgi:RNA polymerase sigma-70 factor (family 1)
MTSYSSYTDQELVALLKEGDHAAFTEIYNRHWQAAYRSSYRILDDDEACTDVVQDVFVWLWEHRVQLEIHVLKSYILTAVKFKMLNVIRQGKLKDVVYQEVFAGELDYSMESNAEVKELMQIIAQFADDLPTQARQIFHMSRYEHLSNKEIALRMGISEKTVKNQINISLKKLRITLGKRSAWMVFFY